MTVFETDMQISSTQLKTNKFETPFFTFGSFDWNLSIVTQLYSTPNDEIDSQRDLNVKPFVFLNRMTGFENPCRVQYRCLLGEGKYREDSAILDQISDVSGRIRGFQMRHSLHDLVKHHGVVRLYLELYCCNTISEAKVPVIRNPSPTINCYDRNKQVFNTNSIPNMQFLQHFYSYSSLYSIQYINYIFQWRTN